MSKKFYISDWHYGHANVIHFDNRPFKTVEEMNGELIRRWNSIVSAGDIIYSLGDMFWCKASDAIPVLEQLNGQIFLVKGNHDRVGNRDFDKHFVKIDEYMEVDDNGRKVVLCHYPIICYKNHYHGWYHLYGHVHSSFEHDMMEHDMMLMRELYMKPHMACNVGAMMPWMNYTPQTLDDISIAMGDRWRLPNVDYR